MVKSLRRYNLPAFTQQYKQRLCHGIVDMMQMRRKVQDESKIWTPFKIWNETQWFSSKLSLPHDSNPAKGKRR